MSPIGDATQLSEHKGSTGLASVFKSFGGGNKLLKSPHPQSPIASTKQLSTSNILGGVTYGGILNYEQLFEQLKRGNPLSDRLAAAEALRHAVQDYPISGITSIFREGKDLIEPTKSVDSRVAGFELLTACVQHASSTDPERLAYFQVLTAPANPEDFHLQLASLVELAKHGKDLSGFRYQAVPLLTLWLKQTFTVTTAARKHAGRQNRSLKGKAPLGEETNLALLFAFIVDVIKFSFNVFSDEVTSELVDIILHICVHTPLSSDLKTCINVIDAIITYGEIPSNKLMEVVKVLCSIHCLVEDVQPEAWRSISNLCKSHNGQITVRMLLDILRRPVTDGTDDKQQVREIRGALSVLEKLFAKNGENGYPLVPFTLLMDALQKVNVVEYPKVKLDILRLILTMFQGPVNNLQQNVIEEDWSVMFEVVSKCSERALEAPDARTSISRPRMASTTSKEDLVEQSNVTTLVQTLHSLILCIEELINRSAGSEFFQREECINFFVSVHSHLPETSATLVIDYFVEYRRCYPSDIEWKKNIKLLLGAFFSDRTQSTHIRLHALKAITDVFHVVELMDKRDDPDYVREFASSLLEDIGEERDISVLQHLVAFVVAVSESADNVLFDYIIDTVRSCITTDSLQPPLASPPGSRHSATKAYKPAASGVQNIQIQSASNVVTKGIVQIFMRSMDKSSRKALRSYDELLRIARSHDCETDARISALKMLLRLRADWAHRIFLTPFTESDGLAASLYRTPASLTAKQAADEATYPNRSSRPDEAGPRIARSTSVSQGHAQGRQSARTSSGVTRTLQRHHQMWMSPDPDALPEITSGKASSLLLSSDKIEEYGSGDMNGASEQPMSPNIGRVALDIGAYLDIILSLLKHGCEWEVYSYILVHLASQLTNQALFKRAIPQIRALRDELCEQIKNSSFHDPSLSSGLRKVDVVICLFQTLTMVVGYHREFSKAEQDEIVRTFLQGLGAWDRAAKCCVHALSICCHELPGSASKSLIHILQKMSQIITQSHVAIHILEFLACLARLPNLYVNFREEEYRTVFAICFRYLQYVRDQPLKESNSRLGALSGRVPGASVDTTKGAGDNATAAESNFQPNTSDDLPQYVYALAYHVIIFWFLSLKLTDRASQVSWIAKSLLAIDSSGKEKMDEQALVTLDFMQRVAYADVDESAADPTFTTDRFGEILKKRWIVGHSLVTIEQATRGGWAQITKRQPSGTSCYIIREKFNRPPAHQVVVPSDVLRDPRYTDTNVVLPSHLLLQLTASIPQATEFLRPIPLPDDDMMRRAVAAFDRNFTVDGHKVGVIYCGENQTSETEILANIMGSSDYIDFLSGLGTLTKLKGAKFNTQGLDREYDTDGEYGFCWRDRVTEIVFHVTTQMPTDLEHDPQCIGKKRHIGNDFVNIIFNNSGLPFKFDTFPSDFNYVNVVITPESRASFVATRIRPKSEAENTFYKVQVMSKPGFPEISPAAETKIVSLKALPGFIRLLALNASVFSLVWANREGGEHVSSWRNRLREIERLREKYGGAKQITTGPHSPQSTTSTISQDPRDLRHSLNSLRRTSVANFLTTANENSSQRSSVLSTAETEVGLGGMEDSIIEGLDFSRWA